MGAAAEHQRVRRSDNATVHLQECLPWSNPQDGAFGLSGPDAAGITSVGQPQSWVPRVSKLLGVGGDRDPVRVGVLDKGFYGSQPPFVATDCDAEAQAANL